MSTALYRRYRPESFAEVIGQEHVTGPLMQALRTGRINHAYLFSGPRGCGKTTSARILARCLNCEQGPTPTPCGVCESCVALARGGPGSVDVIEIDAASHGGVDDARDLRERASYGPAQSRYKVYIIDEAHMVTPQGFNALLKIVEEPPEHVKFIFATTEPEKVIGTIRSRTHHYPFRLVPPAALTTYMQHLCEEEGVSVAPGVLGFVVRAGGGSVRDSLSVLDQLIAGSTDEGLTYEMAASLLGFTDGELIDATIDAFAAGDGAAVFAQVDKVVESGHDPRRFVEDLLERLRDLIVVAAVPDGAGAVLRGLPDDQLDRMRGQAARFGDGGLSRAADIVNTGLTEMTGATAPRLQLELICARILLPAASGERGYAARLDRIERRLEVGAGGGAPGSGGRPPSQAQSAPPRPQDGGPQHGAPQRESHELREEPESHRPVAPATAPAPSSFEPTAAAAPRETSLHVEQGTGFPAPGSAPAAGGLDVAAIRRVWPDVLARIFSMRRATWTFVSQHAQVQEYDGRRLVLGIATVGLANTFRQGNHAELVRQALIDEIGLDVVVEGVPATDVPPPKEFPLPADDGGVSPRDDGGARRGEPAGGGPAPAPSGGAQPRPFDRPPGGEGAVVET
ncbi:MAG: DNA polymerase III subunit gamma and tau, partial [Actinomycetota bacterium]|nr:DNA polymerase III subunit gamma and tau [Actinomycetota bacterium]